MNSLDNFKGTKRQFKQGNITLDDLIEEKLDSLDMWIKKIEKSNKPFHI